MNDGGLLFQAFVFLAAAVVAVPIASRLALVVCSAICSPAWPSDHSGWT
mgnify:CR=1 FL=1